MPVLPGDRGGLGDGDTPPILPGALPPSTFPTFFPTTGPPGPGSVNAGASERGQGQLAAPKAGGVLPIVYGRSRVEGRLLWQSVNGFYQATFVVAWCTGPIESIAKIWVGTRETTGVAEISVTNYTGTSAQTANTVLAQSFPGSPPGSFPYVAYSVITVTSPSTWGSWTDVVGSDVTQFFAEIEGKKVEDTRIALGSGYSTNPVLCLRDFLTSEANGLGIPTSLIDDTNFEAEADKCDVTVGGSPKFTLNLTIANEGSGLDILHQMRAAFNCDLYMWNGLYRCFVDVEQTTPVVEFDTATNCSDVQVQLPELGDTPTVVIVKFPNVANNSQIDQVRVEHPGIAAGTQEIREAIYQIDGISTKAQANRVATYLLNVATLGLRITFLAPFMAVNLQYGDLITLTTSDGLAAQELLVQDVERQPDGMYKVVARQYHDDIYDEVAIGADGTIDSALPDPFITVPPPSRITADSSPAHIRFGVPRVYTDTLYGAAYWTAAGTWGGSTTSKINDGIFSSSGTDATKVCAHTPSTGARLVLDLGSGNTATFLGCRITGQSDVLARFGTLPFGNALSGFFEIEYSDDGSAWTTIEGSTYETAASLAMTSPSEQLMAEWDDVGAHRYWRVVATTGGTATFDEVQFLTSVPYRWVKEYRVYAKERNPDGSYTGTSEDFGDAVLFGVIPVGAGNVQPYLDLLGMESRLPNGTGYISLMEGFVTAVSTMGIESAPVAFDDTSSTLSNSVITTNEVVRSATGAARQTGGPTVAHADVEQLILSEIALPSVSASGKSILVMDSATHTIKASVHGAAFAALGGGATSPLTTKGDLWGFSTVDARLPVGTDGHIIVADSTQALGVKYAAPASVAASTVILTGAIGSRPAAGTAGRIYVPTDSWYTFRDTGAAWEAFRSGRIMYPLDDSGWTGWVNQGTAARDTTTGTLRLTKTFASGDTQSLRYKSAPSTPWTITCCFRYGAKISGASQYLQISLGGRQSSDGKLKMVCAFHGNNAWTAQASKWDSATAYNSDIAVITPMSAAIETDVWVRMTDNGTDVLFDVSADGYDWLNVSTDGRTNFCTIDQVFIAIQAATASYTGKTFAATVLSYEET